MMYMMYMMYTLLSTILKQSTYRAEPRTLNPGALVNMPKQETRKALQPRPSIFVKQPRVPTSTAGEGFRV